MRRLALILVVVVLAAAAFAAIPLVVPYGNFPAEGVYVAIPHGASKRTIARLLAEQDVIRSRWVFEVLARSQPRRSLQAGEYFFDRPVTSLGVYEAIANGRVYTREL